MIPFDGQITFCSTADLAATARFYEGVLELPLVLDQGACRIYRVAPNAYVGFCQHLDAAGADGLILTLLIEDVTGTYQRLRRKGVEFEQPPRHNPRFQIEHCFLRDPNGILIEIQRFLDPRWSG